MKGRESDPARLKTSGAGRSPSWLDAVLVGLLGSVALVPLLPVLARAVPPVSGLERLLEPWLAFQCERDPVRMVGIGGVPLAVCARCSGIYFGLGAGALLAWPRLSPRARRSWLIVAALLMLADVAAVRAGLHGSWPAFRLLVGVLLAYPVGLGLGAALRKSRARLAEAQRP